jgi:hypothetical protein
LIYFIFRDDTYVVSSAFASLMIIGGLAAGVRTLLEKGPPRHHISEDQKILAKYPEIHILPEYEGSQKGRAKGAAGGPHHQVVRASPGRTALG